MRNAFNKFAVKASLQLGSHWAFGIAALLILGWALMGPVFGFRETWVLFINTSTTIVTFLMVFPIQNTQNRHIASVQLKSDELIRAIDGARNRLLRAEEIPDEEMDQLKQEFDDLKANTSTTLTESGS